MLFCRQKEVVDESFPGDIVGLHDTGSFRIGDTLTAGEKITVQRHSEFLTRTFPLYQ